MAKWLIESMSRLRFVTGERAIKIGNVLVVADLHIGVEYRFRKGGIAVPSQTGRMRDRLEGLVRKTGVKRLVVLGDIKDDVPGMSFQEEREVPVLFRRMAELVEVEITPGNHDAGIGRLLPRDVLVHPSSGFMLEKTWLCHGHAWPDRAFLDAEHLVIGHQHAGIEFRDRLGYRWGEPVWIRAELDREIIYARYKQKGNALPELVMMPVFNEFACSIGANRPMSYIAGYFKEGLGPLFRATRRKSARVFMLDGTYLGELGKL
jgi:putative SbcD/Mre11-related phosphoesterase